MHFRWAYAAVAALSLYHAAADLGGSSAPVQVLETRHSPESSERNELWNSRRNLDMADLRQRNWDKKVYKTNGSLGLMWTDATLYS